MISLYSIIKKPIITEKTSAFLKRNKISFEVAKTATKYQIISAFKKIFHIKPLLIHTIIVRGKIKHIGKTKGKQKNIKKAIITVNKDTNINDIILDFQLKKKSI